MTIEEAIKDFEREYPDYAWTIRSQKIIKGLIMVTATSPYNSNLSAIDYKAISIDIAAAFLILKDNIKEGKLCKVSI